MDNDRDLKKARLLCASELTEEAAAKVGFILTKDILKNGQVAILKPEGQENE